MAATERRDLLAGRGHEGGLPGVWSTALATLLVLGLLAVLVWIVVVNALGWFWPASVWRLETEDGRVVVGALVGSSASGAGPDDARQLHVKTGLRERRGGDFLWLDEREIVHRSRPADGVRVLRHQYGDAFGVALSVHGVDGVPAEPGAMEALLAEAARLDTAAARLHARIAGARQQLTRLERRLATLERSSAPDPTRRQRLEAAIAAEAGRIGPTLERLRSERDGILRRLAEAELTLDVGGGRRVAIPLSDVRRVQWPNRMGTWQKAAAAAAAFGRFLVTEPREANTEGGVAPALFGTVMLVLLMSVAVTPFGVVTAVWMTEYARDGLLLRLATHAVHNLAGVPSIVFGMFGLAFFVYGLGGAIDRTFFGDRLPTPTFGTGGILWASLTLALLTVPVVVVATREGLLAVPRGWREGSLALGATRWQTLSRVVLPAAMPGVLTGVILAVSRAAGEVAPLMLTGAVKLAPALPLDGEPPFLHLERKFMHLGFHIYDISMQSPNVEAAKPMAFASTLVLLGLVVCINLTAIVVRRRLLRTYRVLEG